MGKFSLTFGLAVASLTLGLAIAEYEQISAPRTRNARAVFANSKEFSKNKTPMHKVLFTQRGYIQFLRWELPVPEIEEFTFCLWVKSTNLTYSHSILSYSKNEEKRLIRSWISPFGRSVHLEIGEAEIFAHPTRLEEHRWYHICQSWENGVGRYALWIDGLKEVEGYVPQLQGHVIEGKGDIVVGQEYTDFDKGFEEGIEGAVVGFNLLLASAFEKPSGLFSPPSTGHGGAPSSSRFAFPGGIRGAPPIIPLGIEVGPGIELRRRSDENEGTLLNSADYQKNEREGIFESTLKEYLGDQVMFGRNLRPRSTDGRRTISELRFTPKIKRDVSNVERTKRQLGVESPLGLQLVDLSYNHCEIGRGSPFIGGSKMLISWTRTPVKVFGGAILKSAKNTCGDF